VTLCFVSVSPW